MNIFEPKQFNKILVSMRSRDNKAAALFYEKCRPIMISVAYEVLKNRQDAEDVASDRYLYFLNKPEQKYVEHPFTWLKTAARFAAIQLAKRKLREDLVDFSDEIVLDRYYKNILSSDNEYEQIDFKTDFYKILDLLDDEIEKEILTLRIKVGMTAREISQTMGLNLGIVKYRIMKIKGILKKYYT